MSDKKKTPGLFKEGYHSYGVTKGGKQLVTFADNSDMVTDKEDNNISLQPKNLSGKEIEFVRRGRNNKLPYDIMKKIAGNVTVSSNIEFKNKIIYGDGVLVYRKYRDENGKIVKEEVLPEEQPEIFDFLEDNDYDQVRYELANDLAIFYDSYVKYVFSKEIGRAHV